MVENIKDIRFDDEFAFSTSAGSLLQLLLCKEVWNARWYNGPCINSYSLEDSFPAKRKTTEKDV